jgi:ribosome-binding protein aMBF1 (putative translation factor)
MGWIVELLDARVRVELEVLPADMKARFRRIVELIQDHGLERVREPPVKHLEGAFMGNAHERQGRNFPDYLRHRERPVKKTQKTPRHEFDLAWERVKREKPMSRIRVDDLHKRWMKDSKYRREYKALEKEFSLVSALIEARTRAGLTQEQLARRMKTTQAVIARLEGGGSKPSTRTLERYAEATGSLLRITFEPEGARP